MQFDILTLFPEFFKTPLEASLIGKAIDRGLLTVRIHNIRDWSEDKHKTVDDLPYGSGPGMVMKPGPIVAALEAVKKPGAHFRRIYFSPRGVPLRQDRLATYQGYDQLVLLCGRYEGVDQRVIDHFIDEEVSIGDYVLAGGELPALVFLEAVSRLLPGVVGKEESLREESFAQGFLEYPQYTRPELFREFRVPSVLLSGDHQKITQWRQEQALEITRRKRPDLLKK